jgi:hypothetical protein
VAVKRDARYGSYTTKIGRARQAHDTSSGVFFAALKTASQNGTVESEREKLQKLYRTALKDAQRYLRLGKEARDKGQIPNPLDVTDIIGNADLAVRFIMQGGRKHGLT